MKVIYGAFDTYQLNTLTPEQINDHVYNSILKGIAKELPNMVKIQAEPHLDGSVRYTGSIAICDNVPWNTQPMINFDKMREMKPDVMKSVDDIVREHLTKQQREQEEEYVRIMKSLLNEGAPFIDSIAEQAIERFF